jgi:hypothetical protein
VRLSHLHPPSAQPRASSVTGNIRLMWWLKAVEMIGKVLRIGLVLLLYPCIVSLAVVLLAAVQLRSASGSAFDTWRLNYKANLARSQLLRADLKANRDELLQADGALISRALCLTYFDDQGVVKPNIDGGLQTAAKEALRAGQDIDQIKNDVYCFARGYRGLLYDQKFYTARKTEVQQKVDEVTAQITENTSQYSELIKGHGESLAFLEMENVNRYFMWAIVTPYDLLILLLVMFMGALGGMVRLLREYGDPRRDDPVGADYVFIPLIGLVVAIGGYVMAKTGLLLLTASRDEVSLSPFMVGLVGIVSGLLAKDVIDALARAGGNLVMPKTPAANGAPANTNAVASAAAPAQEEHDAPESEAPPSEASGGG